MALVDEIAVRLSSQSVGSTTWAPSSWTIRANELQEAPDQQIAIKETGGFEQLPNSSMDRKAFQVLVRAKSTGSSGLDAKVDAVISALDLYSGTPKSHTYIDVQKQGDVLSLGRDGNDRFVKAINFIAWRNRST